MDKAINSIIDNTNRIFDNMYYRTRWACVNYMESLVEQDRELLIRFCKKFQDSFVSLELEAGYRVIKLKLYVLHETCKNIHEKETVEYDLLSFEIERPERLNKTYFYQQFTAKEVLQLIGGSDGSKRMPCL